MEGEGGEGWEVGWREYSTTVSPDEKRPPPPKRGGVRGEGVEEEGGEAGDGGDGETLTLVGGEKEFRDEAAFREMRYDFLRLP